MQIIGTIKICIYQYAIWVYFFWTPLIHVTLELFIYYTTVPFDLVWYISNELYVKYGTNEKCMEDSLDDLILISLSGKINPPILNQSHALNSLGVWFYFSKVVSTHSYVSNSLLSLFYFVWIYPAPRSATGSLVPSELPCSPLP